MEAGVNFIDTADQYVDGRTEGIVGKGLKGKRHSVVLATKVGSWKSGPSVNDIGLSRKHNDYYIGCQCFARARWRFCSQSGL